MKIVNNKDDAVIHCLYIDDTDNLYCLVVSAEEIPKLYKFKLLFD